MFTFCITKWLMHLLVTRKWMLCHRHSNFPWFVILLVIWIFYISCDHVICKKTLFQLLQTLRIAKCKWILIVWYVQDICVWQQCLICTGYVSDSSSHLDVNMFELPVIIDNSDSSWLVLFMVVKTFATISKKVMKNRATLL